MTPEELVEGILGSDKYVRLNTNVGDYLDVSDIQDIAADIVAALRAAGYVSREELRERIAKAREFQIELDDKKYAGYVQLAPEEYQEVDQIYWTHNKGEPDQKTVYGITADCPLLTPRQLPDGRWVAFRAVILPWCRAKPGKERSIAK